MTTPTKVNSYNVGQKVTCSAAFINKAGTYFDPDVLTFSYRIGEGGQETTLTYGVDAALIRDGLGLFHVDVLPTGPGGILWYYGFRYPNETYEEFHFLVKPIHL